jgi:hypothetical protein
MTGTNVVNPDADLVGPETSFLKVGGSGSGTNHCRLGYDFFELRMSLKNTPYDHIF